MLIERKIWAKKIEDPVRLKGEVVPVTPSPKPLKRPKPLKMPAKKSTTAAVVAPMPATAFPVQGFQFGAPMGTPALPGNAGAYHSTSQMLSGTPQFQFAPTAFQFGAPVASPQAATGTFGASIPMAQSVAIPAPVVAGPSAIEMMEAQMKTMREYIANMEKTFKEAKKGMKKPRIPKDPNAPKNPIPEGTQAWNAFVELVQKEETDRIRSTDPTKGADWKGITRKEAMAKAKELKAAGDPRYNYVKKEKPASPTLAATAAAIPGAPTEAKKRGRKPKAAATALPPAATGTFGAVPTIPNAAFSFPTFASTGTFGTALPTAATGTFGAEETLEVEEKTINGQTYLVTAKNECWQMLPNGDQGAWAGIYNGSIIVPAPEPM